MKKTLILLALTAAFAVPGRVQAQVTAEEFNKLKARVVELEARVKVLEGNDAVLGKRVSDNDVKLKDLARPDPSDPNRNVLDLLGNMQRSEAFRSELHNLTTGRLVIENKSGGSQYLYINGTLWRVVAGKSYAPVPRGVVTVQRPGFAQENLDKWQYEEGRGFVVQYEFPQVRTVNRLVPLVIYP